MDSFLLFLCNLIREKIMCYSNGDWGLGIGDWGLGVGGWGPNPKPQNPKPKTQNPHCLLKKKIFFFF